MKLLIIKYDNGWALTKTTTVVNREGKAEEVKIREVLAGGNDVLRNRLDQLFPTERLPNEERPQAV